MFMFYVFWNLHFKKYPKSHCSFTNNFFSTLSSMRPDKFRLGASRTLYCSLFSKPCCYWLQLLFTNLTFLLPVIIESWALPVHSSLTSTCLTTIMAKLHSVWQNTLNIYVSSQFPSNPILKNFQIVWGQFCDVNNILSSHFKREVMSCLLFFLYST